MEPPGAAVPEGTGATQCTCVCRAMLDPYLTLGVSRHADAAAIRRAYRILAARVHPDRQPSARRAWAHTEMVRLNLARDRLLIPVEQLGLDLPAVRMWPFILGFWLCFVISLTLPFVVFMPEASQVLLHIVTSLTAAALGLSPFAYVPLLVALGVALWVSRAVNTQGG